MPAPSITQTGGSSKNGNLMMPASDLKSSEFAITDMLLDIDHASRATPALDKRDKYTLFGGRDCLPFDGDMATRLFTRVATAAGPYVSVDLHLPVIF